MRDREREHRWALLRRHTIGFGSPLLERTRLLQTPWFGLYLHHHHRPDRERHLHDHPWAFVSLILRGRYVEEWAPTEVAARWAASHPAVVRMWPNPEEEGDRHGVRHRAWGAGSVHRIHRGEFHRIRLVRPGTVTLLLVGRRRSGWGFATEAGFIPAAEYEYMAPFLEEAELRRAELRGLTPSVDAIADRTMLRRTIMRADEPAAAPPRRGTVRCRDRNLTVPRP